MHWRSNVLIAVVLNTLLIGCRAGDALKIESTEVAPSQEVILVRIPPYFDPNLSSGENHCVFSFWRYPPSDQNVDILKLCKGAGLPNDGVPLTVRLHEDDLITVNAESNGNLSDLTVLHKRLSEIFEERRLNGVFEVGTDRIEKGVGLRIPLSVRYEDAFKIARTVKESGADPIILLLDGHLPTASTVNEN